jgi:hypothetical protein
MLNSKGLPLKAIKASERRVIILTCYSRVWYLWDNNKQVWKGVPNLRMRNHPSTIGARNNLVSIIPWNLTLFLMISSQMIRFSIM